MFTRYAPADLSIRSDGRTVHGVLVPFASPAEITEGTRAYTERFAYGAFSDLVGNAAQVGTIKLLSQHQRRENPLGRAVELAEDRTGLVGAFRVSKTTAGDEAIELVRDGALDSFSIGFEPVKGGDDWNRDRTEVVRRKAKLREVSLVTFPAYAGAQVAGVRSLTDLRDAARARARAALALSLHR